MMKLKEGDRFYLPCIVDSTPGHTIWYRIGEEGNGISLKQDWLTDIEKVAVPIEPKFEIDEKSALRHATPYGIKIEKGE